MNAITNTITNTIIDTPAAYTFTLLAAIDADKIPEGKRLCRMVWKLTPAMRAAGKTSKRESLGAGIDKLQRGDIFNAIETQPLVADWIISKFEEVQDTLIRETLGDTGTSVHATDIGIDKVIAHIVAQQTRERATSTRLSAQSIKDWFAGYAATIAEAVAAKTGLPATSDKVARVVSAFADNMALLAGKKRLPVEKAEQLLKALDTISASLQEGEADSMVDTLLDRIEVLTAVPDDIDLGEVL